VAVFLPVGFASGIVGKMMREFAFTVAGAVLVSMFVAFTLTPMLASRFLKSAHAADQGNGAWARFNRAWEKAYGKLEGAYSVLLNLSLKHRWKTLGVAALTFVLSLGVARFIGAEFAPQNDQGLIQVNLKAAPGTSLDGTEAIARKLESRLLELPGVETVFATVGNWQTQAANEASITVRMHHGVPSKPIEEKIRPMLADVAGADAQFQAISMIGGGGQSASPIQLKLLGPDLDVLDKLSTELVEEIAAIPGAVDIRDNLETGKPEMQVTPRRDLLASTGVPESTLMGSLRALVAGEKIGDYSMNGRDREIRLRLEREDRTDAQAIQSLTVSGAQGPMMVADLAEIDRGLGPVIINRDNRNRVVTVEGNVTGRSLGEVTADITALLEKKQLPQGVTYAFGGDVQQMQESFGSLLLMMALAIAFIYMVLAAQFESYIHPFTIMLSLPLAIVGALLSLFLFSQTLSIISIIGIITLMGLVTKNAILVVEFANQLREEEGLPMLEAVKKAAPIRLRPILMTTFAMILGMAPMATGLGAGSETRQAMGIAIIGGLITSTLLTLVVVPVVYTMLDRFTVRGREERRRKREAPEEREPVTIS
ncbi:MAG: efflux RND transporter permease subunit, partial [Candidatus Sericytochromatia bacterium]